MNIDNALKKIMDPKNWEDFCIRNFGKTLSSPWFDLLMEPISDAERKELFLQVVGRLLDEKRIVFPDPWYADWEKPVKTWHADKDTIVQTLREHWPPLSNPEYAMDVIEYMYKPNVAWIGRGEVQYPGRDTPDYFEPGALFYDGAYLLAEPGEWE
ncbi:hypothetical protein ACSSZE_08110 [Acidithiobacillus caldus]